MDYKDYYQILGVSKAANEKEIKRAYRRLAQKYHPDKNPDNKSAEEKFKEINEAYEVLGTAENRTKYDQLGHNYHRFRQMGGNAADFDFSQWFGADAMHRARTGRSRHVNMGDVFGAGQGNAGFSEFFEHLFGSGGLRQNMGRQQSGGVRQSSQRANLDVTQSVEVTLEEVYHGATRTFEQNGERFTAKIPTGAKTGTKIRLRGKGNSLRDQQGDLYLVVQVAPHPIFTREKDNLRVKVEVDVLIATLGGQVTVPTLSGPVNLTIPPGTQGGQTIRLKGKGMPQLRSSKKKGDLLAKIQIRIPQVLTAEEQALYEQLVHLSRTQPA
jgi:curved DNA-binding protein